MNFLSLYARVLGLLGSDARLGWSLAIANVALATAQFAEPVLFGRIIDALANAQGQHTGPDWSVMATLLGAWVGFGLFSIVCGALVALFADRLAHRRRHIVLTEYFEHVLQLPLSYHGGAHSGRLMKVMLAGTDTLWWLWVSFFRDNFAAFASFLVLLPLALYLNWRLAILLVVLSIVFVLLTLLVILLVGVWLYRDSLTSVGEIVTFMNFAGLLISRLEHAVSFANQLVSYGPRLREFFEVLDTVPAVRDRPDAIDPGHVRGLVEFKDVTFSYDGKRPAVSDLTFTAQPGETIALVGMTGAGKSTALALLHRVFDPQTGAVLIDGKDIRTLTLSGLRRNIGVVFQEALLFNRTIAENLRVGKPDAT